MLKRVCASWYGPGFDGKTTANGESYDQNELTAAHRTLQMPSLVRVTNLDNGRAVVLRVNDRGPYSRGRIIDVSSKAADLLGFKKYGTAKVRVETLPISRRIAADAKAGVDTRGYEVALNGNPRPADPTQSVTLYPDTTAVAVNTSTSDDTMQAARVASVESVPLDPSRSQPVQGHISDDGRFMPDPVISQQPVPASSNISFRQGHFQTLRTPKILVRNWRPLVLPRFIPPPKTGENYYRVRLGPYSSIDQADAALARIQGQGTNNAVIVVE